MRRAVVAITAALLCTPSAHAGFRAYVKGDAPAGKQGVLLDSKAVFIASTRPEGEVLVCAYYNADTCRTADGKIVSTNEFALSLGYRVIWHRGFAVSTWNPTMKNVANPQTRLPISLHVLEVQKQ
jgi:hypothetical protein